MLQFYDMKQMMTKLLSKISKQKYVIDEADHISDSYLHLKHKLFGPSLGRDTNKETWLEKTR